MRFKTIEFAVYCSPCDDTNFKVFERVLKYNQRNLKVDIYFSLYDNYIIQGDFCFYIAM